MTTLNGNHKLHNGSYGWKVEPGEEVVISGIAGRFPKSDNVQQFRENLFNKVDLISDDQRWKLVHPEIPKRTGIINNIEKFDATFFDVDSKQAHSMDPMSRMLIEHSYEAIVDAGYNPSELENSKTGVFIGASTSESEKTWMSDKIQLVSGRGLTGCSRAMLANRISHWLKVNGPSQAIDSACSSSLYALEHAYRAIRDGLCDAAIVGGVQLCLHPYVALQFRRLGVLSLDGSCKSFDVDADGYCRAESIGVVFLQKAKYAKRIYSMIVHAKTNCDGFKEQGICFPSSVRQAGLMKDFYDECDVSLSSINYLEAHGTGTTVGDPEEINSIDEVICKRRNTPLRIGSVKSNMGHSEPASGLCSVAKVIIAMENGLIPPNLHYKRPQESMKAIQEGRIKVITETTPWEGGLAGINGFGFGGANVHVLLKSNPKTKVLNDQSKDILPYIVGVSARTEKGVTSILDDIESRPVDPEYIRLYYDIHVKHIVGHRFRGYSVVGGVSNKIPREIKHYSGSKKQLWFVCPGTRSGWLEMGRVLMAFPVFAKSMQKCDAILRPRGMNIYDIFDNKNVTKWSNILCSYVGTVAVQISLIDLFQHLNIVPDKIIGTSVGEFSCAYSDGCLTIEQALLCAYFCGVVCTESKVSAATTAVVGLRYQELKDICPADIEIMQHNEPHVSCISGPTKSVYSFVRGLEKRQIYVEEIPFNNSRSTADIRSSIFSHLKAVISNPKERSSNWLSTSIPCTEWSSPSAQWSSAEYHLNTLQAPLLWEQTADLIPKEAIILELASIGSLEPILQELRQKNVTNVQMMQNGHDVKSVLQSLGQLYNEGLQPQFFKLYPEVKFPVSRGTPMISPLIKWEHSYDWYVSLFEMVETMTCGERIVEISLDEEHYQYIVGHMIDGRNLFPATGYLRLVWETVAMMKGELFAKTSVVFEDIKFLRATTISSKGIVELTVMVQKGTGKFEVIESGTAVVTGFVRVSSNPEEEMIDLSPIKESELDILERDIYKELRLRGYQYSGLFRGITCCNGEGTMGKIAWKNNWVTFMDNMLQMKILRTDTRGLFVPTGLQRLVIDTKYHDQSLKSKKEENKDFMVYVNQELDTIRAGGVQIQGLKANAISKRKPAAEPVLEYYSFVADRDRSEISLSEAVRLMTHVAMENGLDNRIKTIEFLIESEEQSFVVDNCISLKIVDVLGDVPLIQADVNIIADNFEHTIPSNANVLEHKVMNATTKALIGIGQEMLSNKKEAQLQKMLECLISGGFIITRETLDHKDFEPTIKKHQLNIIMEKIVEGHLLLLLRKKEKCFDKNIVIKVDNNSFGWVENMKEVLGKEVQKVKKDNARIIFMSQGDSESGLIGLVNCLRRELGGEIVRGVLVQDTNAAEFSLQSPFYMDRINLDLAVNVLRSNGTWGSYRHLPLQQVTRQIANHIWVNQMVRGDLSSLQWLEGPIQPELADPNLIHVVYAAMNFKDVMLATAKLAPEAVAKTRMAEECLIGLEYCGYNETGRRLMGVKDCRCISNLIIPDTSLIWEVPESWSFEDAATVPCVYATCYYALYMSGKMRRGDKVLIHAGSGGIGQAAINLALYEGCEVFTTVGTEEKRKFIRERFPQIMDDHIGNSRDCSFEQLIMKTTNGRGVDIVLNSLAEEKLRASVRCLAKGGRFLEIGKFDLAANNHLDLNVFTQQISYHGIMLDNLFSAAQEEKKPLWDLLTKGLRSGAVKPLTRTVFAHDQLEAAFRFMASGKHIGKVIIKVQDENTQPSSSILAVPRYHCSENKSYIVLGGLGGFGLELADWLVLRGARNLVLTSRTGLSNGYQKLRVAAWKSYGVNVLIVSGKDASEENDCKDIIEAAVKLAPVDGIFNLAVVLEDALWENQTKESFETSFRGKAWSTKQLDKLSRTMCPQLRHFVVFSSVSCGRGNAGQTNYGMANSVMERICENRAADGLPGLAVEWGAVGDVGLVAEMEEDQKELVIGGTLKQKIYSCLKELDGFLRADYPVVSSMVVAEKRAGQSGAGNILDTVMNILGLTDLKTISQQSTLPELGMDSMMGVEIKQTLEREFEIFLTSQDIRALNFSKLTEMSAKHANEEKEFVIDPYAFMETKILLRNIGKEKYNPNVRVDLSLKKEADGVVFFIAGIDGLTSMFMNIATKLKCTAICLQPDMRNVGKPTITSMVDSLLPEVMAINKDRRNFVVVGYSYGSLIALEMVNRLEKMGLSGRLFLIDGSPEIMKVYKDVYFSSNSEDKVQNNLLQIVMDALDSTMCKELSTLLEKCVSWDDKVELFCTRIPENTTSMTKNQIKEAINAIHKRFLSMESYDYESLPSLRSPISLIKPTEMMLRSVSEDYGLQKITRGAFRMHNIEGNHTTLLDNMHIADIINAELVEEVSEV